MSSIVNIDMCLIASTGLLPNNILHEVFMDTLNELNGHILNNVLYIDNNQIGKISLKNRIVIQTYNENQKMIKKKTEELRNTFTRRSQVAIENYEEQLKEEKRRIQESNLAYNELLREINKIDKAIEVQAKAVEKQKLPSCEAMVFELKESAENQGYDVLEEHTKDGVELQFIRRVY